QRLGHRRDDLRRALLLRLDLRPAAVARPRVAGLALRRLTGSDRAARRLLRVALVALAPHARARRHPQDHTTRTFLNGRPRPAESQTVPPPGPARCRWNRRRS